MNRRTLARSRFARTSAEGGGGGTGGGGENQQQQSGGENQQQQSAPVEATDEHGVGLGFPKETKVEDMTDAQRANYWRNQSRVQQKKLPSNLAQIQADAQAWADHQKSLQQQNNQQNQQQGGNEQTREQIEAQIRKEAAEDSALALLRTSLHTRGKNLEEIDELVQFVNTSKFVTSENKVDTAAVITYLDKIAPTGTGGGGGGLPGQGRHEQNAADRAAAGKNEAERRGFKPASGKSSLLPTTS